MSRILNLKRKWICRASGFSLAMLLILAWAVTQVAADFALSEWRYQKEIFLPSDLGPEGLVELTVDPPVYVGAATGLADLRVVRDVSEEVPYQLTVRHGTSQRAAVPGRVLDLGHVPGQDSSFVVDLGQEGLFHNEIEIHTRSTNFQREVTIAGSNDRVGWAILTQGVRVFDLTLQERNFATRDTTVSYPESTARYLRVNIRNGNEAPLELSGASVFSLREDVAQFLPYPTSIFSREEDDAQRTSVFTLDLGQDGLPSSRLSVTSDQVNFYREIRLEGSEDAQTWRSVRPAAALYSYATTRFTGSSLDLDYPEVTYRHLRLTILNEDDPPLAVTHLEILGIARQVVFQPRMEGRYWLYYGNMKAQSPSYDLERILPYLEMENIAQATLGPEAVNPAFEIPQPPVSERFPWLIPVGVAAAAVVVGLLLFGVLRQARRLLPPEEGSE